MKSFATVMQSSCSSLCMKCGTSSAHFFAAAAGEPLLGAFILGLAKPFWGLTKAFWVAGFSVRSNV